MLAPKFVPRFTLLAGCCALAVFGAPAAQSHGIESTLERLGGLTSSKPYQLESKFSTGLPASDAAVRMVSPDGGMAVELGHTNARGQLTFTLPAQAKADWEVQVDAGPGHRDYIELPGTTPATLQGHKVHTLEPLAHTGRSLGAMALVGSMVGLLLSRRRP
jgi:nickel transport protein